MSQLQPLGRDARFPKSKFTGADTAIQIQAGRECKAAGFEIGLILTYYVSVLHPPTYLPDRMILYTAWIHTELDHFYQQLSIVMNLAHQST